jgi:pimeloyl-ACP methyl ester carboxylesterase
MTRYPTLERLHHLIVPTLVIAGLHDPLVKIANAPRLAVLSHVDAVTVPGAHALNYSDPQLIAELIEAHMAGEPLWTQTGRKSVVGLVSVKGG